MTKEWQTTTPYDPDVVCAKRRGFTLQKNEYRIEGQDIVWRAEEWVTVREWRDETEEKELRALLQTWRERGKNDLADSIEYAPDYGEIWAVAFSNIERAQQIVEHREPWSQWEFLKQVEQEGYLSYKADLVRDRFADVGGTLCVMPDRIVPYD